MRFSHFLRTFVLMNQRKQELSILIPTYNYDPSRLVASLRHQAEQLVTDGLRYEIIVGDDGSTTPVSPPCTILRMERNLGRAAIRNALTRASQYQWLLFLDSDIEVLDKDFLKKYLTHSGTQVVDGGLSIGNGSPANLRFLYEKAAEPQHVATERRKHPYRSFRTTNFMISRQTMLAHPFDERFRHYGYEDVLFGKVLQENNIPIEHIDASVVLTDFESNPVFVAKTEEGLRTLCQFRKELYNYSTLLQRLSSIPSPAQFLIRVFHRIFSSPERRWLTGNHPFLPIFTLYRIGYFLSLKQ